VFNFSGEPHGSLNIAPGSDLFARGNMHKATLIKKSRQPYVILSAITPRFSRCLSIYSMSISDQLISSTEAPTATINVDDVACKRLVYPVTHVITHEQAKDKEPPIDAFFN
jgi:hypothetical protein